MHLVPKRILALFHAPERELQAIMPELRRTRSALLGISDRIEDDPLAQIVNFFRVTSPWHDRIREFGSLIATFDGVNYGQYVGVIATLRSLASHFAKAGRSDYGMNRTDRGEHISVNNVFLGGLYEQVPTRTVFDWQQHKDDRVGQGQLNHYEVVSVQAREFMRDHIGAIVNLIAMLEKVAEGKAEAA